MADLGLAAQNPWTSVSRQMPYDDLPTAAKAHFKSRGVSPLLTAIQSGGR